MMRLRSLKALFFLQEFASVLLVALAALVASLSLYFWHSGLDESTRLNRMHHLSEKIRSEFFRQIQHVFFVHIAEDKKLTKDYLESSRVIGESFDDLRRESLWRVEDEAVQLVQRVYREIQLNMNNIVMNPYLANQWVRARVIDPVHSKLVISKFEQPYSKLQELLSLEHQRLETALQHRAYIAIFGSVALFITVLLLVVYLHILFRRQFIIPINNVMQGTRAISRGNLQHRISQIGATEVAALATEINAMASDLKISQDTLLKKEKQAAFGALVPVVAHNIRNPLASIKASAQVMEGAENEEEIKELREAILMTTERLERWVSALIAYLHPMQPNVRPVFVGKLLQDVVMLLHTKAEKKQVHINVATELPEFNLKVDIDLMEQAIHGLLMNAIDASEKGGEVRIGADVQTNDIVLWFEDDGSGMPFTPKLADLEPGPSTKKFGTGLGIPFAFKICQVHGWNLSFCDKANQGTRVNITIPMEDVNFALNDE